MIRITCYTKKNCEACHIMIRMIGNMIADINDDNSTNIVNINNMNPDKISDLKVNVFPTTIIEKNGKQFAKLEGTFPEDYVKDIIYKLEKE